MTTTGRRSGKVRRNPVQLVEGSDGRWLVAPYGAVGWVHNVRASSTAGLQRGRLRQTVRLNEVVDPVGAAPVLKRYLALTKYVHPYFDASPDDDLTVLEREAPRHPVFEVLDVV